MKENLAGVPVEGREMLRVLVARQEIADVLARYARGVDRGDWELVSSCYHPDAFDDHGPVQGTPAEVIAFTREALAGMTTMHCICNVCVEIDGDTAWSESYAVCYHRFGDLESGKEKDMTVGARYIDRFDCRHGGPWLIAHRTIVWDWSRIDPVDEKLPFGPRFVCGRRDHGDPSFAPRSRRAGAGERTLYQT